MYKNFGHKINEDLLGWCVEKKFTSRKNEVFLVKTGEPGIVGKYQVYKKYSNPDRMHQEIAMLRLLKSKEVPVPQIYGQGEDYIILEYLEGPLLLDSYCWQESASGSESISLAESTYQSIHNLCCWFKSFHSALPETAGRRLIMGDVNFRNFIVKEKIYGIDLEECREGRIEEEVGSLSAFALTYTPSFTSWKLVAVRELLRVFTSEFDLNKELVENEIKQSLLFLGRIRGNVSEMAEFLSSQMLEQHTFS